MIWLVVAGVVYLLCFHPVVKADDKHPVFRFLMGVFIQAPAWVFMMYSLFHGLVQIGVLK